MKHIRRFNESIKEDLNKQINNMKLLNDDFIIENTVVSRNDINKFINDFGFFISLNLSQVTKMGIDDNGSKELNLMMATIRKPIINGMTYFDIVKDLNVIYNKPKLLSALFSKIREFLIYIEPRIERFVKDSETKTKFLEKIVNLKNEYKNIISKL